MSTYVGLCQNSKNLFIICTTVVYEWVGVNPTSFIHFVVIHSYLTLSWRIALSYRNQSIDLTGTSHMKELKSGSHLPKNAFIASPLKTMKKYFLFHLKSSFCSQDIWVFVRTCRKIGLTISLTSKFMTSHLVYIQLQYTYCLISHKVKVTRQWNLVN